MKVILLEKIRNLGDFGEILEVKPGYGRNFLIPQGKAVPATASQIKDFEAKRSVLEKAANEKLKEVEQRAKQLQNLELNLTVKASEEGKLYGSIGPVEIAKEIKDKGFDVNKQEVYMPEGHIKETGEFELELHLYHSDLVVNIKVIVIAG